MFLEHSSIPIPIPSPAKNGNITALASSISLEEVYRVVLINLTSQFLGHFLGIIKSFELPPCRALFGRGQIIKEEVCDGRKVFVCGSDPRADGCVVPSTCGHLS